MAVRLSLSDAETLARKAFEKAGVRPRSAGRTAMILVEAEAMGIATHGLSRVSDYCARIAAGGIDREAVAKVEHVAPALLRVDGRHGLGPTVMSDALEAAMETTRQSGVAAAFLHRASHLGALAPYLNRAAESGFAGIIATNTAPMIAPPSGREARIGNNPLGVAIPHPAGRHVILDMALSVAARSRVRAAAREGRAIPDDWATGPDGRPTTDPTLAMRGLMRAIGGDKGANLALCLDLLAGLGGAAMLSDIPAAAGDPARRQDLGQIIVLIDVDRLIPKSEQSRRLEMAATIIAETPALEPGAQPRLPGARALAGLGEARSAGIALPEDLVAELHGLAQ